MATFPNVSLILIILHLLISGERTSAAWCVARTDASPNALQHALDYACGAGADCTEIQPSGSCFQPDTVEAHASYAFNSYYMLAAMNPAACVFAGNAMFAKTDPSYGSCVYPASPSMANGTRGNTSPTSSGATSPPPEIDNGMPQDGSGNVVTPAGINDTPMNGTGEVLTPTPTNMVPTMDNNDSSEAVSVKLISRVLVVGMMFRVVLFIGQQINSLSF
ncbi:PLASMODESMATA CALLOSE-BINDING PROTEIN 2-like [Rutidosis leptorrhynchoides]|uniref:PLASMODESMATA CALLOSE-BINDING PROTEIN 2-like n=1 Tax=Rutidosis leptorrhynchoides TaxID=125765 RepID=UPI003A99C9EE